MGLCRFIYKNKITSSTMLTANSYETGNLTTPIKTGTGGAACTPSGTYTGTEDLEYVVEIDSTAAGTEVGQSLFKWSDSGGATWNATGVTTTNASIVLSNGVAASFTSAAGADFALADKWYWKAYNQYGLHNVLDGDPDTKFRSATIMDPANQLVVDLGAALPVNCAILYGHNGSSNGLVQIYADSSIGFASAVLQGGAYFSSGKDAGKTIIFFTEATYQYWAFTCGDTANPDGKIEFGEAVLSTYTELTNNFELGPSQPINFFEDRSMLNGALKNRHYNYARNLNYSFPAMPSTDKGKIEAMINDICDKGTGRKKRIYFKEDSTSTGMDDFWMVDLEGVDIRKNRQVATAYDMNISMQEIVKTGT